MPALRRWMDGEYRRLRDEGKGALADHFEAFVCAYFEGDVVSALAAIPELDDLVTAFDEPGWSALLRYYTASANIAWHGDLTHGIEEATRAVVEADGCGLLNAIPGLYTREILLSAWLDVDGPGYAPEVRAALDEIDPPGLPADLAARFTLLDANLLALAGEGEEASRRTRAILNALDWPEPFRAALLASCCVWEGRWQEALTLHERAANGYAEDGLWIEQSGARLGVAEACLMLGDLDGANRAARQALAGADQTINRALGGMAAALLGRLAKRTGDHDDAESHLSDALTRLDGLGWRRLEAETALRRLENALDARCNGSTRRTLRDDASHRIDRLKSTDLADDLERIITAL